MNDYTLLTDDQLVSLYVSGQDNAFDVLLERYKNRLYNYILYIVHKEDTADDLFQETFVKAIVTLRNGGYRADGKFQSVVFPFGVQFGKHHKEHRPRGESHEIRHISRGQTGTQ